MTDAEEYFLKYVIALIANENGFFASEELNHLIVFEIEHYVTTHATDGDNKLLVVLDAAA
eukprot:CAMPEP_0206397684 /NCGR_PEP_ID=MMETSP0294-20121207/23649_1 /ASSEMBLY_ACC=CAM_ASM_000327 /TAXON_ID=39354 /ORGANISM="Heterosigma akashiwo, Strain CCMP2393" /LENGTH=59 /DNA_ID=CAMNT_0053852897 /DNA_START=666 /DNA_END=842 /DNA_ORIENTATION=+